MYERERLSDAELYAFFDRLFPDGFAGADVVAEIAQDGCAQSLLKACFCPPVDRVVGECVEHSDDGPDALENVPATASGQEHVDRGEEPRPANQNEEITELVGCCVWDIFSDNHEVIAADGRLVDLGTFRGSSAFLDEYLGDERNTWREGDDMRFYLGSIWMRQRVDLAPVYAMIFRRLTTVGADWVYHFPELYLTELGPTERQDDEPEKRYSLYDAAVAELEAQKKQRETQRFRTDLDAINARAREEAVDRPPPATVRAYRQVYVRDPRGWPPA